MVLPRQVPAIAAQGAARGPEAALRQEAAAVAKAAQHLLSRSSWCCAPWRLQGGATGAAGTDFSSWSDAEIKGFLDQRGEDYDDCPDRPALVGHSCSSSLVSGCGTGLWHSRRMAAEQPNKQRHGSA